MAKDNKESYTRETTWKAGMPSPNKGGRPKGTGKPISKLRSTIAKLRELEPDALLNIKKSIEGQEVDANSLATSKWLVTTVVSTVKAALSEELAIHGIRQKDNELADEAEKEQAEETPQVKFSLVQLPTAKDLESK